MSADKQNLIDLSLESWRFANVFKNLLSKLNEDDYSRYHGRYLYFRKKLDEILAETGLRLVEIPPGTDYDIGMAAIPINIDEFDTDSTENENLQVDNMIEPIIMGNTSVIRNGKITLRRKTQ